jgi:hypothetical protein
MATSPRAIPVKVRTRTLRQMCIEADPEFYAESRRPVAYEFSNNRRVFREVTAQSGPYADD